VEALKTLALPGIEPPEPVSEDERYTQLGTLNWCMAAAGVSAFDLDVAACDEAHCAPRYFTKERNGLRQTWDAHRIWCNPPFSLLENFVAKAHEEDFSRTAWWGCIALLAPATRTEQLWWQRFVEPCRDGRDERLRTFFLPFRSRFGCPGNPKGLNTGSPRFACVLLVWRDWRVSADHP
jgi:hypothetical protein